MQSKVCVVVDVNYLMSRAIGIQRQKRPLVKIARWMLRRDKSGHARPLLTSYANEFSSKLPAWIFLAP